MKVLSVDVTIDTDAGGGCAERTYQLMRALARRGVDCSLLILDIGLSRQRIESLGAVTVHVMPCLSKRYYVPRVSFEKLCRIVKDADIIHLMGHWEITDALIYLLARYYKKPYVNCPAGSLKIYGRSRFIKRVYNKIIGCRIIRHANRLIAIAEDEFDQFRQYGAEGSRVLLIPNGIDPDDYTTVDDAAFRKTYHLGQSPLILFVGRLTEIKGPDLLMNAFHEIADTFSDYHLVLAGPDQGMLPMLKQMANEFGLQDRIHFIGYIGDKFKSMAYHAADLLVIPSRQEAMSIVVLEAGATGTPVLATDKCGLNMIENAGGGQIVPASAEGLAEGLRDLLSSSDRLATCGEKLMRFVRDRFVWSSIVENYIRLFNSILRETGPSKKNECTPH